MTDAIENKLNSLIGLVLEELNPGLVKDDLVELWRDEDRIQEAKDQIIKYLEDL
jgi:hypothetical protein